MIRLATTEREYPWGVLRSTHASKIKFVLAEKHLAWEVERVRPGDLWKKPPEMLARHPLGKVPWIEDDGFLVWDSTAILEYLEERYPDPPLLPSEPRARADVRMTETFVDEALLAGDLPAIWMPCWVPEEKRDQAAIEQGRSRLRQRGLPWLEARLGDGRSWICGELSLADAGLAATAMVLQVDGLALDDFPQVAAYFDRLRARPAYRVLDPRTSLEDSACG